MSVVSQSIQSTVQPTSAGPKFAGQVTFATTFATSMISKTDHDSCDEPCVIKVVSSVVNAGCVTFVSEFLPPVLEWVPLVAYLVKTGLHLRNLREKRTELAQRTKSLQ